MVGLHLVAAGQLMDIDPELAYQHAQEAVRRAGRVDIVREAAGLTAYSTGRFAEALRELRTVRRLNGSSEHLAIMADCERGLERPERAIALAASPEAATLDEVQTVELAIVVSGARLDLGETEAAEAVLAAITLPKGNRELAVRVIEARLGVLEAAGRTAEAAALLATLSPKERATLADPEIDADVVVFDLQDDADAEGGSDEEAPVADEDNLSDEDADEDDAEAEDVSVEDTAAAETSDADTSDAETDQGNSVSAGDEDDA